MRDAFLASNEASELVCQDGAFVVGMSCIYYVRLREFSTHFHENHIFFHRNSESTDSENVGEFRIFDLLKSTLFKSTTEDVCGVKSKLKPTAKTAREIGRKFPGKSGNFRLI